MIILSYEEKVKILNKLNENYEGETSFEERLNKSDLHEFGKYDAYLIEHLTTEDEGKYQYGGEVYRLLLNKEETDMTFMETWTRSGSYFSDYFYEYNKLMLCEQYEQIILDWRVI